MLMRIIAIFTIISFSALATLEVKNCFIEKCVSLQHNLESFECDTCPTCVAAVNDNDALIPSKRLFLVKTINPIKYTNLYSIAYTATIYRPPIA